MTDDGKQDEKQPTVERFEITKKDVRRGLNISQRKRLLNVTFVKKGNADRHEQIMKSRAISSRRTALKRALKP